MGRHPTDSDTVTDYVAIRQLRSAYSHAVDTGAWEDWAELFTEDATCALGFETLEGREAIEEYGRSTLEERFEKSFHFAHMPLIDISGDEASGRWYIHVYYELPDTTTGRILGRYHDTYERLSGHWKFERIEYDIAVDTGTVVDV